ncbi:NCS2 family permease [Nocardiopsis sp. MG754419]|uniref:NCS2 family permease n=1 Tax=Nocardiopsis sp. MG754419 TaxID=2259865 RepID=UPI001BA91F26|nr:NCS2 family permease [Nocardiopsis sp. MG754419]MBR8742700.1 NCS2 family permease [Nocardiopsis sp. MG754419]
MNAPTPPPSDVSGRGRTAGGPLDRFFHISERGSTLGTEIRGGLATFFAMAYILVLNPLILGEATDITGAQLDIPQLVAVTALVAAISSILMGFVSRYPFALAAGMGLNAVVAYAIAPMMTWADVFLLLILEGIILTILVLTGFRTAVFAAIPAGLKIAIGVGVGLFLTIIGFVNSGFVQVDEATLGQLGNGGLTSMPLLVFVLGLAITIGLYVRRVPGAMLLGIVIATLIAIGVQALAAGRDLAWQLPASVPELPTSAGDVVAWPDFSLIGLFLEGGFTGRWADVGIATLVMLLFTLMLADFFDTMGTMVGVAHQADLVDEEGNLPKTREVLTMDAFGTIFGGAASASIATVYAESAAGVAEGARTGIAPIVTGLMMFIATLFSPLVTIVPFEAATPVLIMVGFMMMTPIGKIDFSDPAIGLGSFFAIVMMPFTYSIANGIGFALIVYTFVRLVQGRWRQIHPLMWIISLVFLIHFAEHPIYLMIG